MAVRHFHLPDPGEGLTEAEIAQWRVVVGDVVVINQVVVEIETAKSLVELPSPYAGTVTRLLAAEGDTVEVGTAIIEIEVAAPQAAVELAPTASALEPDSCQAASGAVLVGYGVVETNTSLAAAQALPVVDSGPTSSGSETLEPVRNAPRVLAKPPVRRLARDLGVELSTVKPTGPGGIVTREDVVARAHASQPATLAMYPGDEQPWLEAGMVAADGRSTRVPVRSVRKRTAEAMVQSAFTAPHVTVYHRFDITKTMKLVAQLRTDRDFAQAQVTPLLIAMKALVIAVRRHPEINATWDDTAREIVYKHYINMGVAAATPRGLVVPNIKDAHRLSLRELGEELAHLTTTARAGKTTLADTADGTITVTNVGVFGIDIGSPILNPGEAAILALGAITRQPWVHKGKIRKRWVTEIALSFDHRLVDGELGARVLADVAAVLSDPARALVWA